MLLSKKAQYAVKALVTLANAKSYPKGGSPMLVRDLAKKSFVPKAYLGKIISELSAHGLVVSQKGRGGGIKLCRHPKDIKLGECIELLDHIHGQKKCMLNPRPCQESHPCPLHSIATKIRREVLANTSILQISNDIRWLQ